MLIFQDCTYFVTVYSSVQQTSMSKVFKLCYGRRGIVYTETLGILMSSTGNIQKVLFYHCLEIGNILESPCPRVRHSVWHSIHPNYSKLSEPSMDGLISSLLYGFIYRGHSLQVT